MIDRKKEINIANSFKSVGILPNDVVMIHGDAGVAAAEDGLRAQPR